jgi:two-component system sensor histidine kinase RegB
MLSEELRDAARTDPGLAPYAADLELLEQQMSLCTSALARLRSRASTTNRQPVDQWLESFAEQWRLRHPHVKFEQLGTPPAEVSLDDTVAVSQILTILLDNAARASRDHVTLSCALPARGDQIVFEVCDAGPGIPAALRGSLGTMPVDSTQGGHGVGLYLAFSAAARLKGSIELTDVSAARPRGTRAVLRLPIAARKTSGASPQGAAPSNTEKQA